MRRPTKSSKSAFSIPEALVVVFLIGIIFALIVGLFSFGNRLMKRGGKRVDTSRVAVGLSREFKSFEGRSVGLITAYYPSANASTGDLVIALPQLKKADGSRESDPDTGLPMVQSYQVYYRDSNNILRSVNLPITPEALPPPPDSSQLQSLVDAGTGQPRAQRCRRLLLIHPDTGQPTESLSARTNLRLELESTDEQMVTLDSQLRLLP